jgi:hypothetical protein
MGHKDRSVPTVLRWLNILGATLVVVSTGLFAAVHSPLGRQISAGESPGFAWIGANITFLMGFVLAYLALVCRLQIGQMRQLPQPAKMLPLLICIEVVGIAVVALLMYFQSTKFLSLAVTFLLISLLLQALCILWRSDPSEGHRQSVVSGPYSTSSGLFLVLLFAIGAALAIFDPSWRRLSDQVFLDSDWADAMRYLYPPVLSGAVSVWFGIGMVAILLGLRWMQVKMRNRQDLYRVFNFISFFSLVATLAAFLLVSLYCAIPWQINNLNLNYVVLQLFLLLSATGGMWFAEVFSRLAPQIPGAQQKCMIGMVALTLGSAILFPLAWFWMYRRPQYSWLLLPILILGVCVFSGYLVLCGDFFNPWYTAFSYLKGAILSIISVVAAGTGVLVIRQLVSVASGSPSSFSRSMITLIVSGALGFIPFYALDKFPEIKAAVLQYNELARVNATLAREITNALGFGDWFRLGQRPPPNGRPHPWPQPWRLEKTHPSQLPENLYFKIARAEGIEHHMLMKGFGPRDIFPPDLAVTELAVQRAASERRSATADEVFDAARQAIGALPTGARFLCFLTLMDVHNDLWKKEGGTDFGDTPRDLYDNNVSYLDQAFGRFITWFKKEASYDRTVIMFTSDHGEQFWEHGASLHGHTVYEEEIRIPLILVSHALQKRFEDVPVTAADMAPTIADLAGYAVSPPYDDPRMGISLVPLVHGNERERYLKRDVVGRASFKRRYFLYRNWEWKFIYLAELDVIQLFNVLTDPSEKVNLLEEKPALADELEQELLEYLKSVEGRTYRANLSK